MLRLLLIVPVCLLAAACGQQGDLYLDPARVNSPLLQDAEALLDEQGLELDERGRPVKNPRKRQGPADEHSEVSEPDDGALPAE